MRAARRQTSPQRPASATSGRLAAARAHFDRGRRDEAERLCRAILRSHPDDAGALHLLGLVEDGRGHVERAVALLTEAAGARPGDPAIRCDLGNALKACGRLQEALAHHADVARMLPSSAAALSNLGNTYLGLGQVDPAIDCLAQAAFIAFDDPEIQYNYGTALLAAGRFEDAAVAFARTLVRLPAHARAHANMGIALKEIGRLRDAADHLQEALRLDPGFDDAAWNLGLTRLLGGEWRAGFALHETRRRLPGFAIRAMEGAAWDGAPLDGRRLLVHAEQGIGDTMQFVRYLPRLAALGGDVVFLAPDRLLPLLAPATGDARLAGGMEPLPAYDVQAPLMSLPHLLGDDAPYAPAQPYLAADPARRGRWAERLAGPGLRVGLVWQGNPNHRADRRRSVPLAALAPLAAVEGVRLIALQAGPGVEQREALPWAVERVEAADRPGDEGAFLETAAVIANLDVVIAPDTAAAHLAGALGANLWLMLPYVPDWRWGLIDDTTPWYPTARLYRQTAPGDWAGVASRLARALTEIRR
ncbi:MAG: tetratricopeptide repeat protein [Rhodospirillales bacterium]